VVATGLQIVNHFRYSSLVSRVIDFPAIPRLEDFADLEQSLYLPHFTLSNSFYGLTVAILNLKLT